VSMSLDDISALIYKLSGQYKAREVRSGVYEHTFTPPSLSLVERRDAFLYQVKRVRVEPQAYIFLMAPAMYRELEHGRDLARRGKPWVRAHRKKRKSDMRKPRYLRGHYYDKKRVWPTVSSPITFMEGGYEH
jgi:hypothetical protein